MSAIEIGKAIKEGQLTAVQATEQVLRDAEKYNPSLNAYITISKEQALLQAELVQKEIENGKAVSPLAGVPIAIKDNICTKGILTTCASKILSNYTPIYDATVVSSLHNNGAIIIGKLNMDEFAMGSTSETSYYGSCKNPWDSERVPGGSSGGAASAVAGRIAPMALGSDTGGSIRQPASYCGVTGFKPTYGMVSRYGLIAYASSLDQIGPISVDATDCAAIMDIISGKDHFDGTSLEIGDKQFLSSLSGDIKGLRIGLFKECYANAGLDGDVANSTLLASETLKAAGAIIEEVSLPFLDYAIPTYYIIATAEASSNLSRFDGIKYGYRAEEFDGIVDLFSSTRSEGFGKEVKNRILMGTFVLSSGFFDAYYRKALKVKSIIKKAFDDVFTKFDIIMCPTAPTTAPKLGTSLTNPMAMYLSDVFTVSANIAGLPCISIPCGFDCNNMPIGVQMIGAPLMDKKVLNAAYTYQQLTEWHRKVLNIRETL